MSLAELAEFLAQRDSLSQEEARFIKNDHRAGARILLERFYNKQKKLQEEKERIKRMFSLETQLWNKGFNLLAGVDEAGRGPLAGPVVAAAVILEKKSFFPGLNDSKQLSAKKRNYLFDLIIEKAIAYGLGLSSHSEIDRHNIHVATQMAMKRAIENMPLKPDFVLVDGFNISHFTLPQKAFKHGDSRSLSIAAASVLAKVTRDQIMHSMDEKYPFYGFASNMGYGTLDHRQALSKHGPCPIHRRSFRLDFNDDLTGKS